MELNRFEVGLPDPQEKEPEAYCQCSGCEGDIFDNELIINVYGMVVHYDMGCLMKATDAHVGNAGVEDRD